jgi:pyruvate kinase
MLPEIEAIHAGDLVDTLFRIRRDVLGAESLFPELTVDVPESRRESVRNLLHYLAFRRRDVRPLQDELARLGLSSLGRAESHVLASLDAVLLPLASLAGQPIALGGRPGISFDEGRALLSAHTTDLLGPHPGGRDTRIMVTMPAEAATDPDLVVQLIEAGMDVMRVNLAHDDRKTWEAMLQHRRRGEELTGRTCRVLMDLAGPKLRTGPLEPGPRVVRIRPQRDPLGRVDEPAYVWLSSRGGPDPPHRATAATFRVPRAFLKSLHVDGAVRFEDARGRRRELKVVTASPEGALAALERTAYVVPGTELSPRTGSGERARIREEDVPALEGSLRLRAGDLLVLARDLAPGRPALTDEKGRVTSPAVIGCTLPEVFRDVQVGEPVWFDDGKLGGVAEGVAADGVAVRIVRAGPNGTKLKGERGINLPASDLQLEALTPDDAALLPFAVEHADLVGLSFVRSRHDVEHLEERLEELGGEDVGILAKIETAGGFQTLPEVLLALMRWPCSGVMIARGDLAVEGGYRRLAEVQEEILWLCEAAHLPAVWATQVLEGMAKTGTPSRAEISDAAMSARAECVMLNKGPYIQDTIRTLDDILRRMREHQTKKQSRLRRLRSWYGRWPVAE